MNPFITITVIISLVCGLVSSNEVVVGVDYYPEQWTESDIRPDMISIKMDMNSDAIRIGEFMWHVLEPEDNVFNFELLDTVFDIAEELDLKIILGTPTATFPAWLFKKHPDIVFTSPDSPEGYAGASPTFGGRRQYSFNSKVYLYYCKRIVTKIAERYGSRSSLYAYQIDNELGHENSDIDFGTNSLNAWRDWLNEHYNGDINKLNIDWGTVFWSVTYNDFDEIQLPRFTVPGTRQNRMNEEWRSNSNPGMMLSFHQFRADSITRFVEEQIAILRMYSSENVKITTNTPGGVWGKAMNSNLIYQNMDFVSYDNYPVWGESLEPLRPSQVALTLDIVRGFQSPKAKGNNGFMIAEQLIGRQGHDVVGFTPRPGQAIAWSMQSFLHGADSLLFFRYRSAVFGQEQLCYGILDHHDARGTGRKFEETKKVFSLAKEYEHLWSEGLETAEVAVVYDLDNVYAWKSQPQSTAFSFENEVHRLYYPFWRQGIPIDVIDTTKLLEEAMVVDTNTKAVTYIFKYKVLIVPVLMLTADGFIHFLECFVEDGGSLWVSFRNDIKDPTSQMRRNPSRLAKLMGVHIAEFESLNTPLESRVQQCDESICSSYYATVWREGVEILNPLQTISIYKYDDNFFGELGYSAVTQSRDSKLVYVGAGVPPESLVSLAAKTLSAAKIHSLPSHHDQIESMVRVDKNNVQYNILINHSEEYLVSPLDENTMLKPFDVHIQPIAIASEPLKTSDNNYKVM